MSNITFILTRDKADALLSLLSLIDGDSALSGLYHALLSQMASRPYNFRLRQSETRHSIHEVNKVQLVDKRITGTVPNAIAYEEIMGYYADDVGEEE